MAGDPLPSPHRAFARTKRRRPVATAATACRHFMHLARPVATAATACRHFMHLATLILLFQFASEKCVAFTPAGGSLLPPIGPARVATYEAPLRRSKGIQLYASELDGTSAGSPTPSGVDASDNGYSTDPTKLNYYQVLRSSPMASKSDLKRAYVTLARETHPDAMIGRSEEEIEILQKQLPSFHEVSEAWKILSDPLERKRYDRSLKADEFVENAEKWASVMSESTGQILGKTWDSIVIPNVIKTVKTYSNVQGAFKEEFDASSQDGDGNKQAGIRNVWQAAMEAAKKAGRNLSRQDLVDKALELEQRANNEMSQAEIVREQLAQAMDQRLRLALQTPNSALSSLEASQLLDGFNVEDKRSLADIVQLRKTVTSEIDALEKVEASYYEKYDERQLAEDQFQRANAALVQAQLNAESAQKAEERARKALEAAQELVASTRMAVEAEQNVFSESEIDFIQKVEEAEKLSSALQRRQERVRKALKRKEAALSGEVEAIDLSMSSGGLVSGTSIPSAPDTSFLDEIEEEEGCSIDDVECNQDAIGELRKREQFLLAEQARLQSRAQRLQSRAATLKARADFMMENGNA